MKFINKLERKFGKYAIPNLINYVIVLCVLGAFLGMVNPFFYGNFLTLDMEKVLHGQVWRLFTFIIEPRSLSNPVNMLFFAFELYIYYMIGNSLENAWGAFRFNLYLLSGIVFNILAAIMIYIADGQPYDMGITYVYRAMFFAFATLYPDIQFLIYFVIPLKIKYLAYIYGIIIAYNVYFDLTIGEYAKALAIVIALANFLFFFLCTRNYARISPKQYKRRQKFKKQVRRVQSVSRHKCSVCGRTEEDDENLEFRFCSKCEGNYEYCMEHLFSHEHIHKK